MPLHLDEFQQPEFEGYVENVPPARIYLLRRFLPQKTTSDIDFTYNIITGKYAQAASITGFSASAPLRDTKELQKAYASVAKIQHMFRLDERQILKFHSPRNDEEKRQAGDYVYQNTDDLIAGVDDVEEFLRAQALYRGVLQYDDEENDVHINVDFGVPVENKLTATTPWSAVSTATPLDDITAAVNQFKTKNQRKKPVVMHLTSATEALMLKNDQIKYQVYGNPTDKRLLTKQDLANVFSSLGLPPYEINDDVLNLYGTGDVALLEDSKFVLLGENLGSTMIGPTAEKNFQSGKFVKPKIEDDPPQESVRVGETAFPALQKPQAIVTMGV
jgi:hypothetical protein